MPPARGPPRREAGRLRRRRGRRHRPERRSSASSSARRARSSGARSSPTAGSRRSPAGHARLAPPARSAPRTGSRSSSPAIGSSRPGRASRSSSAGTGREEAASSAACSLSKGRSSERGRALGGRTRGARLARAGPPVRPRSPSSRRSSIPRAPCTSWVEARSRSTSISLESAVARRAFSILRTLRVDSQIRTYRSARSAGSRARSCSSTEHRTRSTSSARAACSVAKGCRSTARPAASSLARAAARPTSRGAFLGAGSLSGPRSPHLEVRTPLHAGAAFVRSVASAAGVRMRVIDRASHSAAYAKSWEAIEGYLSVAGATAIVLSLEERGSRRRPAGRRQPARQRGSREPRPAEPLGVRAARGGQGAARERSPRAACAAASGGGEPSARAPFASRYGSSLAAPTHPSRRLRWQAGWPVSSRSTPTSRPLATGRS